MHSIYSGENRAGRRVQERKALQVLDDLTWDINAEASNEAQKLAKTGKSNRDVLFL